MPNVQALSRAGRSCVGKGGDRQAGTRADQRSCPFRRASPRHRNLGDVGSGNPRNDIGKAQVLDAVSEDAARADLHIREFELLASRRGRSNTRCAEQRASSTVRRPPTKDAGSDVQEYHVRLIGAENQPEPRPGPAHSGIDLGAGCKPSRATSRRLLSSEPHR